MEYKAEPSPTSSQQCRHLFYAPTYYEHNEVFQTHPRSLSRYLRSRRSNRRDSSDDQPLRRYVLLEFTLICSILNKLYLEAVSKLLNDIARAGTDLLGNINQQ